LRRHLRRKYSPLGRTVGGTLWIPRPEAIRFIEDCRTRNLLVAAMSIATMQDDTPHVVRRFEIPISEWAGLPDGMSRSALVLLHALDTCLPGSPIWLAFEFLPKRR